MYGGVRVRNPETNNTVGKYIHDFTGLDPLPEPSSVPNGKQGWSRPSGIQGFPTPPAVRTTDHHHHHLLNCELMLVRHVAPVRGTCRLKFALL